MVSKLSIWCVQKSLLIALTAPQEALLKTLVTWLGLLPSSFPALLFFLLSLKRHSYVVYTNSDFSQLCVRSCFSTVPPTQCTISIAFCEPSLACYIFAKVWWPDLHHYSGCGKVIFKHSFTSTMNVIVLHVSLMLCEFFCDLCFSLTIICLRFIHVALCHLFYCLTVLSEYIIIHLSMLL